MSNSCNFALPELSRFYFISQFNRVDYYNLLVYIYMHTKTMKTIPLVLLALVVSCQGQQTFEEVDRKNGIYTRDSTFFEIGETKCRVTEQFKDRFYKCSVVDSYKMGYPEATCGMSSTVPASKMGSCPDSQGTLDALNAVRSRWGAAPLLWSKMLTESAQAAADVCQLQSSDTIYGETMAQAANGTMACKTATDLWLQSEELYENLAANPFDLPTWHPDTAAFVQAVWKSTLQVGCAKSSCPGGDLVVCHYHTPGNLVAAGGKTFKYNVGYRGEESPCGSSAGVAAAAADAGEDIEGGCYTTVLPLKQMVPCDSIKLDDGEKLTASSGEFKELNTGEFKELNTGEFKELNTGEFKELNTGEFKELNTGEFKELNTGTFEEINTGTFEEIPPVDTTNAVVEEKIAPPPVEARPSLIPDEYRVKTPPDDGSDRSGEVCCRKFFGLWTQCQPCEDVTVRLVPAPEEKP
jgi:hypothetical protein